MAGKAEQDAMEAFITNLNVGSFPHTVDDDGVLWATFDIRSQPAFAFINDDGTVTTFNGAMGLEALTAEIEKLKAS